MEMKGELLRKKYNGLMVIVFQLSISRRVERGVVSM